MSGNTLSSILNLAGLIAAASLLACATPPSDQAQDQAGQSANTTAEGASGSSSAQGGMASGATSGSHAGCGMAGDATTGMQTGCGMMSKDRAGAMPSMDKESMCTMYRSMLDAPNEKTRQAIMDQQMQGMSPEMRQQQVEMMQQQCQ